MKWIALCLIVLSGLACSPRVQMKGDESSWYLKNEGELVVRNSSGKELHRIDLETWAKRKKSQVRVHFPQGEAAGRFVAIESEKKDEWTQVEVFDQRQTKVAETSGLGAVSSYAVSPDGDSQAIAFLDTVVVIGKKETFRFPQDLVDSSADLQIRSPKVHYSLDGKSLFLTMEHAHKPGSPDRFELRLESRRLVAP